MGQMQRQVTWLQSHALMKQSAEVDDKVDYSGSWSFDPGLDTYKRLHQCISKFNSTVTATPQSTFWSLLQGDTDGLPASQSVPEACRGIIDSDRSSQLAFAIGLLPHELTLQGAKPSQWPGANSSCEYSLPRPPGRDPSLVNLLTFLTMVVYVHDEVRKAVWLSYVAAAYSGILPSFYHTSASSAARPVAQLRLWHKLCIVVAPVLQFVTACTVLVSSLALCFTDETQTSIVTIILSNVALSFIVDLDNRIGGMLASQEQVTSYATESGVQPGGNGSDGSTHGSSGNCLDSREGTTHVSGVGSMWATATCP